MYNIQDQANSFNPLFSRTVNCQFRLTPLILTVFAKLVRSLVSYMLPAFTVVFVIKLLASWEKKPKNANIKVIKALLLQVQALCKSIQSTPYEAASLEEMEGDRQIDH